SSVTGPRRLSALVDYCRSWSPSAPSSGSYACLAIVALPSHVVNDDRSHSSSVVDRPTASACSSPTMKLPVRGTLAFPSSLTRWHLLISILSCLCAFANITGLLLVRDQGKRSAVCLLLEPSPLRHAITIHLIRISATFLSSITITATCALSLDPSRAGRRRSRRRCRYFTEVSYSRRPSAWATLSSSVRPAVSNAAGSS
ncbi:hypothetical protein B0H14DRAFT_3776853, partial [Mycena olivaceomarginata]